MESSRKSTQVKVVASHLCRRISCLWEDAVEGKLAPETKSKIFWLRLCKFVISLALSSTSFIHPPNSYRAPPLFQVLFQALRIHYEQNIAKSLSCGAYIQAGVDRRTLKYLMALCSKQLSDILLEICLLPLLTRRQWWHQGGGLEETTTISLVLPPLSHSWVNSRESFNQSGPQFPHL